MYNKYNKNIVIMKSFNEFGELSQVNNYILLNYIKRINKKTHSYKIVDNKKSTKIIITPIEEV